MNQFDNMISNAAPVAQPKLKKFTKGTDRGRWADVFVEFFGGDGVVSRRDAETATNIDAVENATANPEKFLTLMQQVLPQKFTWGEQPVPEQTEDGFSQLVQEQLPVSDEHRADLKRMLGRSIPDQDIEKLLVNSTEFVTLLQQTFPEYNIQLQEGIGSMIRNVARRGVDKLKSTKPGQVAKALLTAPRGKKSDTNPYGVADHKAYDDIMKSGKQSAKDMVKGAMKAGDAVSRVLFTKGQQVDFKDSKLGKRLGLNKQPDQTPVDRKDNFERFHSNRPSTGNRYEDIKRSLEEYGVDSEVAIEILKDYKKQDGDIDPVEIRNILKGKGLSENNLKMKTFEQIIRDTGMPIMEAPEDEAPPAEAPVEPEQAAMEPPVDDTMEFEPDDVDKLQIDMLELVRRALIINPNDIDSVSYSKLTTKVSAGNVKELKMLLNKLVRNHYPDLEMHDIDPGPGVS